MVIPVPEAESDITYYESLYPGEFNMPKQLIHIQRECVCVCEPPLGGKSVVLKAEKNEFEVLDWGPLGRLIGS